MTTNFKWFLLAVVAVLAGLLVFPARVPAQPVITLDQALDIALKKSPALAASRYAVAAAAAGVTQSKAAYYPQVSLSAGYDRTGTESTARNTDVITDGYTTGLYVNQQVYDFGKTPAQVERSRQSLEASSQDYNADEKTLVRDVKQAYYDILMNQQLVVVGEETVTLRQRQLDQARALYEQGLRPKIDVTQAEVQISKARLSLLNARYDLRQSVVALEKILGGPPVAGPYELAETRPELPTLPALAALVDQALDGRPEILGLQAQVKATEAALRAVKRSAFPELSASGHYAKTGEDFPMEDDRWQMGLSLSWPLFTGFRQSGEAAEYKAQVQRLENQFTTSKLAVTEEVTRAFLQVQAAEESVKTAEVALRQAKENLAMAEGRYNAGVSDAIEFSDAQVLYTESRSALVQSIYTQYKAFAQLAYSVGGDINRNEVP